MIHPISQSQQYEKLWTERRMHVLQSWAWGDVKAAAGGWQAERLQTLIQGNAYVFTLFVRKFFFLRFAYAPKLPREFAQSEPMLTDLRTYLQTQKLAFALLDFDMPAAEFTSHAGLKAHEFKSVQPRYTNVVNLELSEDELLQNMRGSYRRNINKALRDGVTVSIHESGDEAFTAFFQVMTEIFAHSNYVMHGREYFTRVWTQLSKSGKGRILLAKRATDIVGAYLVALDSNGAYELYGGVTRSGREVEAGYLLKWEAMKMAKELGCKFYDHWGVAPRLGDDYDKGDELYHISKFKEGFGGADLVFAPEQVLSVHDFYYQFFKLAQRINLLRIRLRKKH